MITIVIVDALANNAGSEDDRITPRCLPRDLVDDVQVVLAGGIGDVDRPPAEAPRRGVESRVAVHGLEHVPVWEDVEVLC